MTIIVRISFTKFVNTKGGSLTDERFKKNLKTFLKFLLNICGIVYCVNISERPIY